MRFIDLAWSAYAAYSMLRIFTEPVVGRTCSKRPLICMCSAVESGHAS